MARLLFLQDLEFEFLGAAYISSMLKKHGHEVLMRIGNKIEDFRKAIIDFKPDFVAFSIMSGSHSWALHMARQVKKEFGIPNVFGGPHPTYFPAFIEEEGVDVIVRGEGEKACLELMERVAKKEDFLDVKNLWISRNGHIYKNDVRCLDENLDEYPFPDRTLYSELKGRMDLNIRTLITSRGCPWHCTFCFNDAMRNLYKDKGRYIRLRKIDKVIEEARILRDYSNTKIIYFADDIFGIDTKWLFEFLPRFKREVGLSFICLVRADIVSKDEKYARYLADNGCVLVCFGVESGSQNTRSRVLEKDISDSEIFRAAELLHKTGIKFRTFNILGLPDETLKEAVSTVKINIDIKTDYPWCAMFMAFPGTRLTDYAKEKGYLEKDFNIDSLTKSFFSGSNLTNHPDIEKIRNLQNLFQTAVLWPWTFGIIKYLIRMPPNIIFRLWFRLVYFYVYVKAEKRSFLRTLIFAVRNNRRI